MDGGRVSGHTPEIMTRDPLSTFHLMAADMGFLAPAKVDKALTVDRTQLIACANSALTNPQAFAIDYR